MARVILLFSVILFCVYLTEQTYFLQKNYIDSINSVASTWKAGVNFHPNTPKETILRLLGSKRIGDKSNRKIKTSDPKYAPSHRVPRTFDARKYFKNCETPIGSVRDQGNCGSCWAFATTGAFADRMCIVSNGGLNQLLSAEETTFCCRKCGSACDGGDPYEAWEFFRRTGVVTGGNYNSSIGCQPYRIKPCLHHQVGVGACESQPDQTKQRCEDYCYGDELIDFQTDQWKTRDAYYLTPKSIQKDVQVYGPVEASFNVYDDFLHYKSGVYQKTENATLIGGHAVKLIGWGVEHGVPYWLMVNSWNYSWGDKGLFKIRRGTNECGIEDWPTAGVPDI